MSASGPIDVNPVDVAIEMLIEALGLEPVIAERERRAAERGRRDSYDAGRTAGRREGRAELLLEWQEAAETIRSLADPFAEMGPTNGED